LQGEWQRGLDHALVSQLNPSEKGDQQPGKDLVKSEESPCYLRLWHGGVVLFT